MLASLVVLAVLLGPSNGERVEIEGLLVDAAGTPLPGVTVTARRADWARTLRAVSGEEGGFAWKGADADAEYVLGLEVGGRALDLRLFEPDVFRPDGRPLRVVARAALVQVDGAEAGDELSLVQRPDDWRGPLEIGCERALEGRAGRWLVPFGTRYVAVRWSPTRGLCEAEVDLRGRDAGPVRLELSLPAAREKVEVRVRVRGALPSRSVELGVRAPRSGIVLVAQRLLVESADAGGCDVELPPGSYLLRVAQQTAIGSSLGTLWSVSDASVLLAPVEIAPVEVQRVELAWPPSAPSRVRVDAPRATAASLWTVDADGRPLERLHVAPASPSQRFEPLDTLEPGAWHPLWFELPAGHHRLALAADGYTTRILDVEAVPDRELELDIALEPLR